MKNKINENEAAPKSEETQDNTEAAFLLEHEYSSIEDIFQMLGQCRNEEYKATAQRILHRGLSLLQGNLSFHRDSGEGYLLLQRAENFLDHLSHLAAALEKNRRQRLCRSLIAQPGPMPKLTREPIQRPGKNQNPKDFQPENSDIGQESPNVSSGHLQPDHPDSMSSKGSRKIPKPFCKSESSKIPADPLCFAGFPLSSSTSITVTVTAVTVSPDGRK